LPLRPNSRGVFSAAFKAASKVLVKAKDAKGMLALIEEQTDMHYEDFATGADHGAKSG
jgi:hypothetical protein